MRGVRGLERNRSAAPPGAFERRFLFVDQRDHDVTGTLSPPPAVFGPPAGPPPERVGCFSRGYEVPGESGGVARVTVTRC